jgi:intracellular sulfur oxidation DsrE/DsrF family protein
MMNNAEYRLDDQTLGSFVDGLLDAEHSETVIRAMDSDPEIREQVQQLRRVKDLMRVGFGHASAPCRHAEKTSLATWKLLSPRIAASVAALAFTFGAGMLSQQYYTGGEAAFTAQPVASIAQEQEDNVILHISESDPQQFSTALAYAEQYLREHRSQKYQIDVVAHAGGLDMMRDDVSPLKLKMIEMLSKYNNVHFIGCANAIRMLQAKGINPPIIAGVETDDTAFDHIVQRLQGGGWKYIKVNSLPSDSGNA